MAAVKALKKAEGLNADSSQEDMLRKFSKTGGNKRVPAEEDSRSEDMAFMASFFQKHPPTVPTAKTNRSKTIATEMILTMTPWLIS